MSFTKKYNPDREWVESHKEEEALYNIYGNTSTIDDLVEYSKKENPHQVLLFTGELGCGKTITARLLGIQMGVPECDTYEYDVGVDYTTAAGLRIRDIIMKGKAWAINGRRLFIIDEFQRATDKFEEGLLKCFESPPEDTIIILCTNKPERVSNEIRSRAMEFTFKPISEEDALDLLGMICDAEKSDLSDEVLSAIWKKTKGIPRNSLTLLERVCTLSNKDALEIINQSDDVEASSTAYALCKLLLTKCAWGDAAEILQNITETPYSVKMIVINYMNTVLLNSKTQNKIDLAYRASEIIGMFKEFNSTDNKAILSHLIFELVDAYR